MHIYREVVAHGSLVDEGYVAVGDLALLVTLATGDVTQLFCVVLQVDECDGVQGRTKLRKAVKLKRHALIQNMVILIWIYKIKNAVETKFSNRPR